MAGDAPPGWRKTTMREVVTFFASGDPFLKLEYSTFGVPVLAKGDVKPFGRVEHGEKRYVSASLVSARRYRTTQSGDYLLTTRDLTQAAEFLGLLAPIPEDQPYLVNQGANVVRLDPAVYGRFLVYWCNGPVYRAYIKGHHVGSTQIHIRKEDFLDAPLWLPSRSEQCTIAHILGTLDDKIELNRRMSETLEAMARTLFKSWFVNFDPVRAKAEGRDPGLPRPLADLFPSRLVDSALGKIPEGWQVGTFADLSVLNPEAWSKQTRPPEVNYVDLSNTKRGRIEAVTKHAAADAPSRAQRVLRPGDTIIGTVRPGNGSYAFISESGLTGSTGFAVLRPSTPQYAPFVYLATTAAENINALAHLADGGAYPAVRPEVVAATPVARPDNEVLRQFSHASGPLLAKMAKNERESRPLAALRDTLLPKLISGGLRLKDTAAAVRPIADTYRTTCS